MKMAASMVRHSSDSFQINSWPKSSRICGLKNARGRAASKVPAGQINLQKAGTPLPVK